MKKLLKAIADTINLINDIIELFAGFSMMCFRSAQTYHGLFS